MASKGWCRAAAVRAVTGACAAAALAGCIAGEGGRTERAPGPAATAVTVVRDDVTYPLTVEVTDWGTGRHPQVPERGRAVRFSYRTTATAHLPETRVQVAVCAVDSADVVLLCDTVDVYEGVGVPPVETGDSWIGPGAEQGPDLSETARVVLLPDQLLGDGRAGDPKDHDGYVPPRLPTPGDRLSTT